MTNKSTKGLIGREAETGRYIPVEEARSRPKTTVVERRATPAKPTSTSKPKGR